MAIIKRVRNKILRRNKENIEKFDNCGFWNNHIEFVLFSAIWSKMKIQIWILWEILCLKILDRLLKNQNICDIIRYRE